jgi:hypothetical protein
MGVHYAERFDIYIKLGIEIFVRVRNVVTG